MVHAVTVTVRYLPNFEYTALKITSERRLWLTVTDGVVKAVVRGTGPGVFNYPCG